MKKEVRESIIIRLDGEYQKYIEALKEVYGDLFLNKNKIKPSHLLEIAILNMAKEKYKIKFSLDERGVNNAADLLEFYKNKSQVGEPVLSVGKTSEIVKRSNGTIQNFRKKLVELGCLEAESTSRVILKDKNIEINYKIDSEDIEKVESKQFKKKTVGFSLLEVVFKVMDLIIKEVTEDLGKSITRSDVIKMALAYEFKKIKK